MNPESTDSSQKINACSDLVLEMLGQEEEKILPAPEDPAKSLQFLYDSLVQLKAKQESSQETTQYIEDFEWLYAALQDIRNVESHSFVINDYADLILPEIAEKLLNSKGIFFHTTDGFTYNIASTYNISEQERMKYLSSINKKIAQHESIRINKVTLSNLSLADSYDAPENFDDEDRMYVYIPFISSGEIVEGLMELTLTEGLSDKQLKYLNEIQYPITNRLVFCRTLSRTEELLHNTTTQASEIIKQSEQLKKYADELHQTSTYKSQFIARVSHEVRTPLNCITGITELLKKNKTSNLDDEQLESLDLISQSAVDLLDIINDLLDIGKIEAGKLSVELEEFNISQTLNYLTKTFQPAAAAKEITFESEIGEQVPETLLTDPKRLQQILKNLISNAIKFTFEGVVRLRIWKSTIPPPEGQKVIEEVPAVVFTVEDTGVGISDEKQTKIWEAFEQADGSTTRIYGGTGLGLTISKELTRLLGGKVILSSTKGKGSQFSLYLPIPRGSVLKATKSPFVNDPKAKADSMAPFLSKELPSLENRKVLLVDDYERNLLFTRALLEDEGIDVTTASNARDAIELIEKFPDSFDVVLMDIMMPEMDGIEATTKIRESFDAKQLPIIALTAMVMEKDQRRCIEAGCNHILPKPIHTETLLHTIQESLPTSKHE